MQLPELGYKPFNESQRESVLVLNCSLLHRFYGQFYCRVPNAKYLDSLDAGRRLSLCPFFLAAMTNYPVDLFPCLELTKKVASL